MRIPENRTRPTPEELVDIHEIQQVLFLFPMAVNERRLELFDDIFAPDVWIENQAGFFDSRDAYRKLCAKRQKVLDASFHIVTNIAIQVEGDRASAHSYVLSQHVRGELAPDQFYLIGGWNDDELARLNDRWLITKRSQRPVWFDGNPEVLGPGEPSIGAAQQERPDAS